MKKNNCFYLLVILCFAGVFQSCEKFDHFTINPNKPTEADPSLELANIEQTAFSTISTDPQLASRYLVYTDGISLSQYYGWQRGSFSYSNISQVVKMEQEAQRVGEPNYLYLAKFFKSYYILNMTQQFGDVPYSQAMQTMYGNLDSAAIKPVYDKQEQIYLQVLNDLKTASDSLVNDNSIQGDIIYGGDIVKWQKLINSFTLRVLISLSLHENDATLNIRQRFNDIVSNPTKYPLFASNSDNGALQYYNITGNQYPYYNSNDMKEGYYLDSSFVAMLKNFQDPRLFVFGRPMLSATLPANDFNAYDGLAGNASYGYNVQKSKGAGQASLINERYAFDPINEPSVLMGYAELQFILAEAAARGWISGSASDYYNSGIQAAMEFSDYQNSYSATDIQSYISQPVIALQSGTAIQQIITQKYISMFMNTGWQPFFEQRRTGYPFFDASGSNTLNDGKIPKRWMYPAAEYNNNSVNVNNAVKSQYPNGDDVNGVMWLIQQ